ncbi:MAG: hypothetical protein ACOYIE_09910 [Agathobaculum sp.]|jgi:hypothetical protein|uniref:hypothetical protein n=1 Tax=Agathobaculum sp. TaxID=2048138 RepID=UPI003D8BFDE7
MERFHNLTELPAIHPASREYFNSLPDDVREQIVSRGSSVHTARELHGYAAKLLRRDD